MMGLTAIALAVFGAPFAAAQRGGGVPYRDQPPFEVRDKVSPESVQPKTGAGRASESVTTVAPLVAMPLAPVPNVGRGATYFTPEELRQTAVQARQDDIDARAGVQQCRDGRNHVESDEVSEFGMEALLGTESNKQRDLQHAAEEAEKATQNALEARRAVVLGQGSQQTVEATELARQTAVRAYQTARAAVFEARARIADLEALVDEAVVGRPADTTLPPCFEPSLADANCPFKMRGGIQVQVDNRSYYRSKGDALAGIYTAPEFADLRLTDIVSRPREENGMMVMRVTGKIVNPRREKVRVPPIWVSAVDQFGTGLKSEQAEPPRGQTAIKAGGSINFTYAMKPMPEKAVRTVVTFAPLHHLPEYGVIGPFCPHYPLRGH